MRILTAPLLIAAVLVLTACPPADRSMAMCAAPCAARSPADHLAAVTPEAAP